MYQNRYLSIINNLIWIIEYQINIIGIVIIGLVFFVLSSTGKYVDYEEC